MLVIFIGLAIGAFIGLAILLALGFEHEVEVGEGPELEADVDIEVEAETEIETEAGFEAGPSMLSIRLLLFFTVGFGVFGVIAMTVFNWTGIYAIFAAVAGAFVCYFVAYYVLKLLWKQQVSTQFSVGSLVGCDALVVQKIPAGGIGEIKAKCPNTGLEKYVSAKAADVKQSIDKGEIVTVKNILASTCIVEKIQNKKSEKEV
jgi:hypothetical protein